MGELRFILEVMITDPATQQEWAAMPSSRASSYGIEPMSLKSPALAGRSFTTSASWEAPVALSPT